MILLKGGKIFDGLRILDEKQDILVNEGRISKIAPSIDVEDAEEIDVTGKMVCPGFIDIHVHFRDPGFEWREDILSGSRAAAAGGYSTVVAMPNTDPPVDNAPMIEYVNSRSCRAEGARVLPSGCVSSGRKGERIAELGKMVDSGAVFFTDDGAPLSNSDLMRTALLYTRDLGVRIMEHPEDPYLTANGQVNEGLASSMSGLKGMPASAEYIDVAKGIALSAETGSPIHFTHVSTRMAMDAITAAKQKGLPVTCDVTAHHLSLDENHILVSKFDSVYKVNPPLRSKDDVKAMWEAIADGTVDAIITDHAPWHVDEKDVPFQESPFGIASIECSVAVVLDTWMKLGKPVDLEQILSLLTSSPAQLLPDPWKKDLGRLEEGAMADITVLDMDASATVDTDNWKSRARNCPWNGELLSGWSCLTMVQGQVVHKKEL
jgi:dihydroorotase